MTGRTMLSDQEDADAEAELLAEIARHDNLFNQVNENFLENLDRSQEQLRTNVKVPVSIKETNLFEPTTTTRRTTTTTQPTTTTTRPTTTTTQQTTTTTEPTTTTTQPTTTTTRPTTTTTTTRPTTTTTQPTTTTTRPTTTTTRPTTTTTRPTTTTTRPTTTTTWQTITTTQPPEEYYETSRPRNPSYSSSSSSYSSSSDGKPSYSYSSSSDGRPSYSFSASSSNPNQKPYSVSYSSSTPNQNPSQSSHSYSSSNSNSGNPPLNFFAIETVIKMSTNGHFDFFSKATDFNNLQISLHLCRLVHLHFLILRHSKTLIRFRHSVHLPCLPITFLLSLIHLITSFQKITNFGPILDLNNPEVGQWNWNHLKTMNAYQ